MKPRFIFAIAMSIASLAAAILVAISIHKNWGDIFVIDLFLLPTDLFLAGLWLSNAVSHYKAMKEGKGHYSIPPASDSSIEEALKGDVEAVEKDIQRTTGLYTQGSFDQENK